MADPQFFACPYDAKEVLHRPEVASDWTEEQDLDVSRRLDDIGAERVRGPKGAVVDNRICRFDGTGGRDIQQSLLAIDDNGDIVDSNDDVILELTPRGSAVNWLELRNAQTGGPVRMIGTGDGGLKLETESNQDLTLAPNGTGDVEMVTSNVRMSTADSRLSIGHSQSAIAGNEVLDARNDSNLRISGLCASTTPSAIAGLWLYKSRGTIASPADVVNEDRLGGIFFSGYGNSSWLSRARIYGWIDGIPSGSSIPMSLRFYTGTTSATEQVRIDSLGRISTNAGITINDLGVVPGIYGVLVNGSVNAKDGYYDDGSQGIDDTLTDADGFVFTISGGIITNKV